MVVVTITSINDLGKIEVKKENILPTPDELTVANEMLSLAGFDELVPDDYEAGITAFELTANGRRAVRDNQEITGGTSRGLDG